MQTACGTQVEPWRHFPQFLHFPEFRNPFVGRLSVDFTIDFELRSAGRVGRPQFQDKSSSSAIERRQSVVNLQHRKLTHSPSSSTAIDLPINNQCSFRAPKYFCDRAEGCLTFDPANICGSWSHLRKKEVGRVPTTQNQHCAQKFHVHEFERPPKPFA